MNGPLVLPEPFDGEVRARAEMWGVDLHFERVSLILMSGTGKRN